MCAYNGLHGLQEDDGFSHKKDEYEKKVNNTNTHRYSAPTSKNIPSQTWENSHPSFPSNSASISANATSPITYMELATKLVLSVVAQLLRRSPICLIYLPKTGSV